MKILMIMILNIFAYGTIKLRSKLFGVKLFKPMIWNFKLSILPFFIGSGTFFVFIMLRYLESSTKMEIFNYLAIITTIIGFLIWLMLLPNSNYLITELNLTHRSEDEKEVPIWYDIVSVMAFALSGILNTVVNINIVQYIYLIMKDPDIIGRKDKYVFYTSAIIINILMSIGIYFGRYIRFNSWDILKPISFLKKTFGHFKEKGSLRNFLLFVGLHSSFFIIVYFLFNTNSVFFN